MSLRTAVFASGRGSNFEVLADHASTAPDPPWNVVLLVTDRAEARARDAARARSIPDAVIEPSEAGAPFAERLLARLNAAKIDLVLLAGFMRLMPAPVVARFRGKMLNLHPALLPGFGGKGMYGKRVHEAVLASGARISGATIHFVDEEYDRGRILAQWPVSVLPDDTPESLQTRIQEVEHALYPAVVDMLARALRDGGTAPGMPFGGPHFQLSDRMSELR